MSEKEGSKDRLNRRKFTKLVAASSAAVSFGFSGTAGADEGADRVTLKKVESDASRDQAETAMTSTFGQQLTSLVNDPDTSIDEAKHVELRIDGERVSHTIEVPTDVGTLKVGYDGKTPITGVFDLERDALPRGRRKKLSAHVGWPEGTSGVLTLQDPSDRPTFARTATDEERRKLTALTDGDGDPVSVGATATPRGLGVGATEGGYEVTYQNEVYHVDAAIETVESVESTSGQVSAQGECVDKGSLCLIDIVMASPHCTLAGVACSVTGPASLGCLTAVAGLCLPNVALVAVSGNCSYVVKNCL